jgi:pyridoxal phosphate enzyme (YggS family)
MSTVNSGLQAVRARIAAAAAAAGRSPDDIALIAVSKTFPAEAVLEAVAAGQLAFGENHAQEGVDKIARVRARLQEPLRRAVQWHFIGPIQSNKTRPIAEHFDWVHSVDRMKVAERLSRARPPEMPPLQVCIQVNVSREESKSGVAPREAAALAAALQGFPGLRLRGLMTIPHPTADPAEQRAQCRILRELLDDLVRQGLALDTLSMGMSDDLEAAIAEGATMVRVGRAIFGERTRG